eukprot:TRINITY_DN721_c1_g1_i2.p1 TRINITY_DN721_c1_g1~~TRINITY_DN721_c1_g1_i2.p1  ORF type:complete len:1291 (+),score=226.35 TRINITY_DN721_c1_g1_i2:49-3921(+)
MAEKEPVSAVTCLSGPELEDLLAKFDGGRHHHMMRMYMLVVGGIDWSTEGSTVDEFLLNVKAVEDRHKKPESTSGCCTFESRPQPYADVSNLTDEQIRASVEKDKSELDLMRRELYKLLVSEWNLPAVPIGLDGTFPVNSTLESGSWRLNLLDPRWEVFLKGDCPPNWEPSQSARRQLLKRFLSGVKIERGTQLKRVTHQDLNSFAVDRFLSSLSSSSWVPCHGDHDSLKELVKDAVFPGFETYGPGVFSKSNEMNCLDESKKDEFAKVLITIHLSEESKREKIRSLFLEPNEATIDTLASYCITRDQFEAALKAATKGEEISQRVSMMLDKEWLDIDNFLINCTFGYEDDTSTLAFPLKYALERVDVFRKMQTCWVFLIPYILLYIGLSTSLLDRPSGYYLIQNVNEHVTNDEIQTEYVTDEKDYFPMSFADIANADDFWAWSQSNLVNYAFGENGGIPGWAQKNGGSNHIIGGIRVRSVRQLESECHDISQDKDINEGGVCKEREGTGDPREATFWNAIQPQYENEGGPSVYPRELCLPLNFGLVERPTSSKRTLTVAMADRPNSLVAAEIFKYLVEDRLENIVVNLRQTDVRSTINELLDNNERVNTDPNSILAAVAFWVSDVESSTTTTVNGETVVTDTSSLIQYEPFGTIDMSTWMARGVSEFCPRCASNTDSGGWTALQNLVNEVTFADFTTKIVVDGFHQPTATLGWNTPYDQILAQHFLKKEKYLPKAELGTTYGEYVTEIRNRVLQNKNIVFYGDDALGRSTDAMKLKLSSLISVTSSVKTYVTEDLKTRFPDVFQLLHKMKFTDADRDIFFEAEAISTPSAQTACTWLKANEQRWHPWIRTAASSIRIQRSLNYNFKCFGVWVNSDKSGSKDGWLDRTESMTLREGLDTSIELATATLPPATTVTPAPGYPDPFLSALRKQISDVANKQKLSTTFAVPTGYEFVTLQNLASEGSTDAFADWTKREGWVFRSCEDSLSDQILDYYGIVNPHIRLSSTDCGGYTFFLPISKTKAEVADILDSYRLNDWIDITTRSVIVEFFVHAQNTGQFARFQYSVEFSSEGAAKPSSIFVAFELYHQDRLVYPGFWWVFYAFSWVLFAIQVYGTYRLVVRKIEALHLHSTWSKPMRNISVLFRVLFSDKYFVVDALSYLLILAAGIMRVITFTEGLSSSNLFCIDVFPARLELLADLHYMLIAVEGWVILVLWARLFFYIADVVEMDMVMRTMSSAIADLVTMLIVFVILILGFTMAGWGFFGDNLEDYSVCEVIFYCYCSNLPIHKSTN